MWFLVKYSTIGEKLYKDKILRKRMTIIRLYLHKKKPYKNNQHKKRYETAIEITKMEHFMT